MGESVRGVARGTATSGFAGLWVDRRRRREEGDGSGNGSGSRGWRGEGPGGVG